MIQIENQRFKMMLKIFLQIVKHHFLSQNFQNDFIRICFHLMNHFYFESFSSHTIYIYIFVYIFIQLAIFNLFFVIFNCNVFSALHAKHFEI